MRWVAVAAIAGTVVVSRIPSDPRHLFTRPGLRSCTRSDREDGLTGCVGG
jgi:hypothetical protein